MNTAAGPGGLLLEAGEAGGVRESSVRFTMVTKVDAGISRFDYHITMRIETETNTWLEIRVSALNDELMAATIKPTEVQ